LNGGFFVVQQSGRLADIAALRDAFRQSIPAQRAVRLCDAITDGLLAFLIVLAGVLVWSPAIGLGTAREVVAARRERRSELSKVRRTQGELWVRQARRNAIAQAHCSNTADSRARTDR
jgi:hypothetical protein